MHTRVNRLSPDGTFTYDVYTFFNDLDHDENMVTLKLMLSKKSSSIFDERERIKEKSNLFVSPRGTISFQIGVDHFITQSPAVDRRIEEMLDKMRANDTHNEKYNQEIAETLRRANNPMGYIMPIIRELDSFSWDRPQRYYELIAKIMGEMNEEDTGERKTC